MRFLIPIIMILAATPSWGQFYMFGGYNFGTINLKGTNAIVSTFNNRENHEINPLKNNFHGYRVGVGKYSPHSIIELGFGNIISRQKSVNPNQLKENAEVVANFMSVSARAGYKPFKKQFFTIGAALHLGAGRIRYSFGGDYETPVLKYVFASEVYIDYAIKIKFLLKKSQRDKYFYLLRIRPYYQFHQILEVGKLEEGLNQVPSVADNAIEDKMNHFGFTISIVIPFMSDTDRAYLFAPKKKRKKRRKRNRKPKPKGRL